MIPYKNVMAVGDVILVESERGTESEGEERGGE